jgi:hypothetical protein
MHGRRCAKSRAAETFTGRHVVFPVILGSGRATVLKMGQISEKSFPKEAATGEKTKSGSQKASL